MYALCARRRFLRQRLFLKFERINFLVNFQNRQLKIASNENFKNQSERTSTNNKVVSLKFDPSYEVSDFTSFGILPFFQEKVNKLLLPSSGKLFSAPDFNVAPTQDQRILLSVLNSQHSLIHKGTSQSGKTLALLMYAINLALSKVPNFGVLKKGSSNPQSVDSIILVPTDYLIDKYEYYTNELIRDCPELCCPDELVSDPNLKDSYIVTRKPLSVKLIYSDGACKIRSSSTDPQCINQTPQVLITTPSRLHEIMENEKAAQTPNSKEPLNEVRFFAVDDIDYILSTTEIGNPNNGNLVKVGKKLKYVNIIEKVVRQLQTLHVDNYSLNLEQRLKRIENNHRNSEKEKFAGNKFKHATFVLNDNSLSICDVDSLVEKTFSDVASDMRPDETLLKRLIKARRKVLYKPIQYCFITFPRHSYQQILLQMSNKKYKDRFYRNIMDQLHKIQQSERSDEQLQKLYGKYLLERILSNDQKQEDPQVSYIEKIIRFDDSKRFYRKEERKLLSVGTFNFKANQPILTRNTNYGIDETESKVRSHFVLATDDNIGDNSIKLSDIDVTKNLPDNVNTLEVFENDVQMSGYNIKNLLKNFMKYRVLSKKNSILQRKSTNGMKYFKNEDQNMANIIHTTVSKFRSEYSLNMAPILFIVPPYVNLESVAHKLEEDKMSLDRFFTLSDFQGTNSANKSNNLDLDILKLQQFLHSQSPRENDKKTNLILHPEQIIGQNLNGLSNMIVIGMESMLPLLAFASWEPNTLHETVKNISGIEDPVNDLLYFYLSKLSSSSYSKVKNFVFVLNGLNKANNNTIKARISMDMQRLSQAVLYNDLCANVDIERLDDESYGNNQLVYGIDKQYTERIKNPLRNNCK